MESSKEAQSSIISAASGDNNSSPRKLHEMTFPEGDVTCSSGISIKQYEEQLNGLKKENFHLKLRIYFLEEKLGTGAPPAVQGLLEHNVRLQVQVEELRRQLTDKQQLLAAAAQAINVLENQEPNSLDSDTSVSGENALKRKVKDLEEQRLEDMKPSDSDIQAIVNCTDATTDGLSSTPEQEELLKVKREHYKALQMIQGCMKRIQQQEKLIKKFKVESDQASEPQVDKYEEILRCKNEHIQDLEQKLRDAQSNVCPQTDEQTAGNLQELLARRLQALAYFLDKLLMHKCVLGEDKKRLAESLLEQSLALPIGLQLDESMAPEEFSMEESVLDISHAFRMEDLTLMFGHHGIGDDCGKGRKRHGGADAARIEGPSDSECWSEPDRSVSLARMGLGETSPSAGARLSTCDDRRRLSRRPRNTEPALHEELHTLRTRAAHLDQVERSLTQLVLERDLCVETLNKEIEQLKDSLSAQSERAESARVEAEKLQLQLQVEASKRGEAEAKASAAFETAERLRAERAELESTFADTERALRRAADEAALQASQAALERTRAHHERMRVERELEEIRARLAAVPAPAPTSDEDRPTSPDQGIDSDRLSSLEVTDPVSLSSHSLYEENTTLKQKLARTKATLADTLAQLNAANMRKMSVQRAICREIHKTHGVLRKARDQFESHNS